MTGNYEKYFNGMDTTLYIVQAKLWKNEGIYQNLVFVVQTEGKTLMQNIEHPTYSHQMDPN